MNDKSPIAWTYRLGAAAGGLSLARETGHVLVWDARPWLVLLNRRGELQGQIHLDAPIVAGAISDDGAVLAVADDLGQIAWLARDLKVRWRRRLPDRPTAIAMDPLGRGMALADAASRLHILDPAGNQVLQPIVSPRPIVQIHFPAAAPTLCIAADFGLVGSLDPLGRWLWQDVPVVHLGTVCSSGDGQIVAVGAFSEGVRRYDGAGRPLPSIPTPEPCRFAALACMNGRALVGGVFGGIHGVDVTGNILWEYRADQPLAGLGLTPLSDQAVLALIDGRVLAVDLTGKLS